MFSWTLSLANNLFNVFFYKSAILKRLGLLFAINSTQSFNQSPQNHELHRIKTNHQS